MHDRAIIQSEKEMCRRTKLVCSVNAFHGFTEECHTNLEEETGQWQNGIAHSSV